MYSSSIGHSNAPPSRRATMKHNYEHHNGGSTRDSSRIAGNTDHGSDVVDVSVLYPRGVILALSLLKVACGCALVAAGVVAFYQRASYAANAAGIWGGLAAVISAVLGVFSVRRGADRAYVLAFFASCVAAVMADVLVIIYSSTGLARDSGYPGGLVRDADSGDLVPVSQVDLPAKEKAMFVNLALIILGVLEVLLSLPSIVLCLRHVCGCYPPVDVALISRRARQAPSRGEWLMSWLGQQQSHVFYSGASGIPYAKVSAAYNPILTPAPFVFLPSSDYTAPPQYHTPSVAPVHHYPSPGESSRRSSRRPHQQQQQQQKRPSTARSSGRRSTTTTYVPHFSPLDVYPPGQFYYAPPPPPPPYPSPGGSNFSHHPHHHPQMVSIPAASPPASAYHNPWMYYGDEYADFYHQRGYSRRPPPPSSSGRRKRPRSKSHGRENPRGVGANSNKRNRSDGPTDSELEKTYSGLDRELAEEFIEQTMDAPARSNGGQQRHRPGRNGSSQQQQQQQQVVSGTEESEAW